MRNAVNWFEIPVADLDRAMRYYAEVLGEELRKHEMGGQQMAMFPYDCQNEGVGGALVEDPKRKPAAEGSLIYLNAAGRLDACVERASRDGGEVVLPKTDIGDPGFIALIKDPDGNCIGLHSPR